MKVFGLINKSSGAGFHRIMMPLLMMDGVDTLITNSITPEHFEDRKPDVVFYNRVVSDEVLSHAKKVGAKAVCDVDDYWHLPKSHPSYNHYIENNFAELQIRHISNAEVVTTTHERLAELIRPHNPSVVVLPNSIPDHQFFHTQHIKSETPRIFWQGSITHQQDIELLRNPMKRIRTLPIQTHIAGYTRSDIWDRMVSAFTNGLSIPGSIMPGAEPHEYYQYYAKADICLAPLLPGLFNSMKSNLKVLEAAHLGLPIICSHVDPYLDLPVLYAKSQSDWYKHIRALVNDAGYREYTGRELHDYCNEHYNYTNINNLRKNIFQS
jgi:glycosyltransferase involved in cell wall biosynthesis